MKNSKFLISFFLIISLVCSLNLFADEAKGPSMILEEPSFSAGEIKEGSIIEHTFKFKNQGDALLEIKSVKPD